MEGSGSLQGNNQAIAEELEQVGFDPFEIGRALEWLAGLNLYQTEVQRGTAPNLLAMRHYLPEEAEQLGVEGLGFLMYVERLGILDPATREMVIDRVMALDPKEIHLGTIKWVTLMALFSQPDRKPALSLLQNMILAEGLGVSH